MTREEMLEQIRSTAWIARACHQSWQDTTGGEAHRASARDGYLIERGRLSGLLWAAVGVRTPDGAALFSDAAGLAEDVSTARLDLEDFMIRIADLVDRYQQGPAGR